MSGPEGAEPPSAPSTPPSAPPTAKQRQLMLAGDPAALARLKAAWAPVRDLLRHPSR